MKMPGRVVLVMVMVSLATGCVVPRVQLPELPPPEAPLAERQRAFAELAPAGRVDRVMLKYDREVGRWSQYVVLGNGQTVAHPADFLPVLKPGAPTSLHAASFEGHVSRRSLSVIIASSILAVGLGVLVGAAFDRRGLSLPVFGAGWGVLMLGGLGFAWTIVEGSGIQRARDAAFLSYPLDLADRLGLSPAAPAVTEPGGARAR